MVVEYLDYIVADLTEDFLLLVDSLMISDDVSWLGLIVAVTLLSIAIGSILMRVT